MENCMKHEIKIMNAAQLEEANSEAIANNYNRTLNLGKFYESVRKFGYDPRDVKYPVFPVLLHERAEGKITEPHMRVEVIGPYDETGMVMKAILDCPMEVYKKLSVYDYNASEVKSINQVILWGMSQNDLEKWLTHVYAIPIELLFMFNLEESTEEWEDRRDKYVKLLLTFKNVNDKETKTYS